MGLVPHRIGRISMVKKFLAERWALIFALICILFCPRPAPATLGVVVMSKNGVVIGIDSKIAGGRHPGIDCKVVHQGNTVIIASGTYDFLVDSDKYEFWDQARQVLAQPASLKDLAEALDARIEPLLQNGLTALYKKRPYLYRLHYQKHSVLEFIVAGMDENRHPAAYHYRYVAATPGEFSRLKHAILPPESAELRVEQIPLVTPYATFSPTRGSTSSQIADQVVEFIDATKEKFPNAAIDDPVTTILIDKQGVRFLNSGKCSAK
jgi:hypothetical protein